MGVLQEGRTAYLGLLSFCWWGPCAHLRSFLCYVEAFCVVFVFIMRHLCPMLPMSLEGPFDII